MSVYTRLCSAVLFPLHERIKRHTSTALRAQLERTQWLDSAALLELQTRRLREFFVAVRDTVPYYGRLFAEAGFAPERLTSPRDLERLPFLTKGLIRSNIEQLKAVNARRLVRYNTGGSSGEPLVFYMGMGRVSHDVAAKWRATRWWGVDIGDPEVVIWGSPVELGAQDRLKAIRDRLFRTHLLPAFAMSEQRWTSTSTRCGVSGRGWCSGTLRRSRCSQGMLCSARFGSMISAYASLSSRARRCIRNSAQIIEQVFGAPVANGYGSRDAGFIAHQCRQARCTCRPSTSSWSCIDADGRPVAARARPAKSS